MATLTLTSPREGVDEQGRVWRWWSYVHTPPVWTFNAVEIIPGHVETYWRRTGAVTRPADSEEGAE